jgi:hypothetical protein
MYTSCKVGESKRDEIRLSYKDGIIMGDEEKRMKLIFIIQDDEKKDQIR